MGIIIGVVVGFALGSRAGSEGWSEIEEAWHTITPPRRCGTSSPAGSP